MKENNKRLRKLQKGIKGITLIALVVTIIVLLILAAVAINLTIGNNGIFTRAQNATQKWEEASKNEQSEIDKVSNFLDGYLNGNGGSTGEMTLVDMFKQAEKDGCLNLDGTCSNQNHLHIGDYVDYKNPTSGTYTITAEKSGMKNTESNYDQTYDVSKNQLNWRVLGIDEETGGLKLIAGSPMKLNDISEWTNKNDPYLYLYGAETYVYGSDEMNNACAMYKNEYAQEARSVNMEDINQVLGIETEEKIKEYNVLTTNFNATQYGEEYGPFENKYTPETWLNGKQTTTVQGKTTAYAFFIGEEEGMIKLANPRVKSMLFDNVEYGQGKAYWLASRGAYADSVDDYAVFGPFIVGEDDGVLNAGMYYNSFYSDGYEGGAMIGVRPVVSLKSNITKNEIARIPDKTEEEWNYDSIPE